MTVEAIERAIQQLDPHQFAELRRWILEQDDAAWDEQIERDAAAGKLDALAAEALADYQAGRSTEI